MNIILIIISLVIGFFIKPVSAVDYSSLDPTNNEPIYVQSGTPLNAVSLESIISDSPVSQDSNENRQASSLKNELEPVYEMNEEVTVELFNVDANSMETVLTNDKDEKIEVQIDQVDQQGITTLIINPPSQLTPGKYTLEIIDQTGSKIEQDFLWGVLAINPNKAIYNSDETADLAMAVLNESGDVICDAKLTLKITDPEGNLTELSTDNKQIIINESVCQSSKLTTIPDYQAFYKTSKTGQYLMELTGETKNGIYTINDSFEVQSNIDFEVERISATRIYPPNNYPMTINIKANQDFKGNVYEEVPASFEIDKAQSSFPNYTIESIGQNTQKIKWSVDLKKGESIKLNYQYKAPNISPQFYLAGPLQFVTLTDLVYKESRQWQIAADATTETITANGDWVVPTNVYSIIIEGWGGGGAGGGLSANRVAGRGGGGAGGQYAKKTITVNPGTTYAVVVGAVGAGSVGTGANGGASIFSIDSTQHMVAMGGAGGQSYDAGGVAGVGTTANGIGDTIYKGGSGSNDGGATGGAGGGGAGSTGNGGNASDNTAGVGTSMMGGRGADGITASDNGGVGITYGAGGGGGGNTDTKTTTDRNGGDGMVGLIKITYTANSPPNTPTNTTPTNGSVGVSLNPTFTASAYSDSESDAQSASQWQIATNSNFSSVVWDTGTTTASNTINVGYTLSYSTLYYWRVRYQQTNQGIWSSYSNSGVGTSFTTLTAPPMAPNIPVLSLPTTGTNEVSITPTFKTVATDANFDNLQYELKICTDSGMTTDCQTFDQTSSNVSWSGQNIGTSAYSSGTTATYVLQSGNSLIKGVTYYWKTRAKDYSGSNTWSSTQGTPNSFVTGSGLAPLIPSLISPGTDVFFSTGVTYPTLGTSPQFVTSADVNGDGQVDLITTNSSSNDITVFTNKYGIGSSTFSTGVTYPTLGTSPYSVTSADVNGDNQPDLIATNYSSNNITVFTNKYGIGSSTFSAGVTYPTVGTYPRSVISADVNDDGQPDLITANVTGNNITVFTNKYGIGSSTFSAGVTYPTIGTYTRFVTSADVNGDGHADLINTNYTSHNITVLTNNGDGTFGTGVSYPTIATYPVSVTSTDLNSDGQPDLVTINDGTPDSMTVFTNNGDGTFGTGVTYPTLGTSPKSVTSADVDGDGKADLVTANSTDNSITVFNNTYSSNISLTPTFETVTTDPDSDYLQYQIKYCSNFAMSVGCTTFDQTNSSNGWFNTDVGTSAYSSGTTAVYILQVGNSLTEGTTYYWQSQAIDPAGKNEWSGAQSTPFTFTTGVRPDIPILSLPTTGTTDVSITSSLVTVATDTNGDNLQYKIDICTDSDMTANCQTFDQTSSNVGWSGQNIGTSAYSSGTTATYTLQSQLNIGTSYFWRSYAIDYSSTNRWSATQTTPNSFVTILTSTNQAPSAPYLPYVNNTTAQAGQQTPVYGLIDHTPAFSAVFDDPDTSDTSSYYQLQIGSDTDWASAETWDSTKSSIGSTCNENSRCADIVYGGGTSLVDGSIYYWRIKFWDNSDVSGSWSETQQFSMNNAPTVSSVVLNGGNVINLSEGSSIGVSWVATATDADVYTNLTSATGKIYRSGLGSTCTLDNNNCYQDASCDFYNCSDNSCSVLCSANLYFFTEATDDTSTFASQYYQAWVQVTDSRTEIGSTTSSSTLVDVNTMSGSSTSSLVYGEVFAGSDTGSSNTVTTVTNTGNSLINLEITGNYMCTDFPSCGGQTIEPQKQQYNLDTFTYGAGTTLTTSPQVVNVGLSKPTQTPSNSYRDIYWGIGIPDNQGFGNYQGSIEILGY